MTDEDWDEYRKLVMHRLSSIEARISDLEKRQAAVEDENLRSRMKWHLATWLVAATTSATIVTAVRLWLG
jgi:hypothetical protein